MWMIILVGHKESLDEAIDQIKSTFNIKIQTEEHNFLVCEFLVSEGNMKVWSGLLKINVKWN